MNRVKPDLLSVFHSAVDAVGGKQVVEKEICQEKYAHKYHIVAIGKAADAMVQGLPPEKIFNGLIISKHGHFSEKLKQDARFICVESDHPVPKEASISAGKMLLTYLDSLPKNAPCLFLISGGASALVEVLQEGWSLADLAELTQYLLANSYSIADMNSIRRKISKIKGGGLWNYIGDRPVSCLIISDVSDDNPVDIGSGLLFPDSDGRHLPDLPAEWLARIKPVEAIKPSRQFDWKIIASLSDAKQAAAVQAEKLGYTVQVIPEFMDGDAIDVARECIEHIKKHPETLFIWGGETTVNLPENPGVGGRNQQLALAAAIQMEGSQNAYLLAAGTDGSDGLSNATGAIVDSNTVAKAKELGLNASDYLNRADANSFFKITDNLVITGATGTNVMDLIIAIQL